MNDRVTHAIAYIQDALGALREEVREANSCPPSTSSDSWCLPVSSQDLGILDRLKTRTQKQLNLVAGMPDEPAPPQGPTKPYKEAVSDAFDYLKRNVDSTGKDNGATPEPLKEGSVRETVSKELGDLSKKYRDKKDWPIAPPKEQNYDE